MQFPLTELPRGREPGLRTELPKQEAKPHSVAQPLSPESLFPHLPIHSHVNFVAKRIFFIQTETGL